MTILEYLMKRNQLSYRESIDLIQRKHVQVAGRVVTNPFYDVPHPADVLVTRKPNDIHVPA